MAKSSKRKTASSVPELGTPEWEEWVFATQPARQFNGRSHAANRQESLPHELAQRTMVEGREQAALMALLYLKQMGVVLQLKPQPFTLIEPDGNEYTPDFLAKLSNQRRLVVEMKAARYLTRQVEADFERIDRQLEKHGLILVLWTDRHPLTFTVRQNLEMLYYASHDRQPETACDAAESQVKAHQTQTAQALIDAGHELNVVLDLCWRNRLHFDLTQPLSLKTTFSLAPHTNLTEMLLAARPRLAAWWNGLPEV